MTDIFRPLTDEEKHGHRLVGGSCLDAHRKPPMHFTPVPVSLSIVQLYRILGRINRRLLRGFIAMMMVTA